MSEQSNHATTDYFIALGLHMMGELPIEEVHRYAMATSDLIMRATSDAQFYSSLALSGFNSGTLMDWQPIFKAKSAILERWKGFWIERGVEAPPYLAGLFFSRFQGRSPLPMEPAEHLIFLKIRNGKIENIEELVQHLVETEGRRAPEGVFAIQTLELSRSIRRRRKPAKGPE